MVKLLHKLLFQFAWRYRMLSEYLSLYRAVPPVVVYTMGKVASTSVYLSLKKHFGARLYFAHTMDPEFFRGMQEAYAKRGLKAPDLRLGLKLYEKKVQSGQPMKVIGMLRDPLARNISDFFERFEYFSAGWPVERKTDIAALRACFMQEYPHDYPLEWFDKEWKARLGVDVYAYPFDPAQGYLQFSEGNRDFLLLRASLPDAEKEKCIAEFTGIHNFRLRARNVASAKPYSELYRDFCASHTFSDAFLERVLAHPYCRHFFTEKERETMYQLHGQQKSPAL